MSITFETIVNIEADRRLIVQLPADVPVGAHRMVAVLEEAPAAAGQKQATGPASEWTFPVLSNAQWPTDMPLNREEMYDDDGR